MEYVFSKIVISGVKRTSVGGGTEYYTRASQMIALPGKGGTCRLKEIFADKPQSYTPSQGEHLEYSRLPVKLLDLWGQYVRGVPKEEALQIIKNYGTQQLSRMSA